ncbi:hypothetical protein [Dactylosporangium matsuzakiense]|uniref:Uncharacterized protein n=1 Tax=Dactylosporangium matsuzakiense TaxID=53360 RepID=A0A9W6KII8_9ACTN|nr:hypothetical protein [Dactylosporangium matsuzakiense]GLL02153.1 hypothetical protein GCM10017581_038950 [Dactylosporangium matsuzakiense]
MSAIVLTGAVAAHPRRLASAQALISSARPGFLRLVLDPSPELPMSLRTAILAWSSIPEGSTHHLVLEDDATLAPGFVEHAEAAAAAAPHAAIALYANWHSRNGGAVRLAALAGARWAAAASEYTPTVALLLPAQVGAGFADYARAHGGTWPDDVVMSRYLASIGVPTLLTVPSLAEHGNLPSLSGNDFHGLRIAACHGVPAGGAGWADPPRQSPEIVPFFANGMAQCQLRIGQQGRFLSVGISRYTAHLNVDLPACEAAFDAAVRAVPDTVGRLGEAIDLRVLHEFWLAGFVLGVLGRHAHCGADPETLIRNWMNDSSVRKALDTLGPGGLCSSMTADELIAVQPPLAEFGALAVAAGARAEPTAARTPARAHANRPNADRAVVGPAGDPLAGMLAGDLSSRGWRVVAAGDDPAGAGSVQPAAADMLLWVLPLPPPTAPRLDDGPWAAVINRARASRARRIYLLDPTGRWAGWSARVSAGQGPGPVVTCLWLGVPYGPELNSYSQVGVLVDQAMQLRPMTVRRGAAVPLMHAWDIASLVVHLMAEGDPPLPVAERLQRYPVVPVSPERLVDVIRTVVRPVEVRFADAQGSAPAMELDAAGAAVSRCGSLNWAPSVRLAEGIWTVAEWLAFEAPSAVAGDRDESST